MAKGNFRINAEYCALRGACALVNAIPYPLAMAMARGLGSLMVRAFGFKRSRTVGRIRSVFPDLSEREALAIAVSSLQNMLQMAIELIRAPTFDRKWMDAHVRDGAHYKDVLQSLVDEGRGVVIMVPHSGNWNMAAWSMAKYGLKLAALGSRQRNPKINAWLYRQYGDLKVLDRDSRSTLVQIKDYLQSGHAFAIMPDLRVRSKDVEVDFLGGKANVSHAGAMFAVKCGSPIVVAAMQRDGNCHVFNHIATLRPDPSADPKAEIVRLTREAMRLIDGAVQARPGEWFWFNKRWILEPVTE